MKLGFIGAGTMGQHMIRHLQKDGHELIVFTRRNSVAKLFASEGCQIASSIPELARATEAVHLCVTDDDAVEQCVSGENGILRHAESVAVIADHSTVSPYTTKRLAALCQTVGIAYLDAPISGGPMGAEAGTLTVMVGGERTAFEQMRPLFETFGSNVRWLGESGAGNVAKLANNLLVAVIDAGLSEAFVLATKMGVDPQGLYDVLSTSSGDSAMLHRVMPKFTFKRNFSPAFTIDLLHKDVKLAADVGRREGIRMLTAALSEQLLQEARAMGLGGSDISAMIVPLEKQTDVEVKPHSSEEK